MQNSSSTYEVYPDYAAQLLDFKCEHAEEASKGLNEFTKAYIYALYFMEAGEDAGHSGVDRLPMSEELLEQCREDCWQFKRKAGKLLEGLSHTKSGHDFLLDRNWHPGGFMNRDLGDKGIVLANIAKSFGYTSIMNSKGKLQSA